MYIFLLIVLAAIVFAGNSRLTKLQEEVYRLRNIIEGAPQALLESKVKRSTPNPSMSTSKTISKKTEEQGQTETHDTKTVSPPALKQAVTPPKPKRKKRSWEEEIGSRWTVWLGGGTLALGAIFLLRFAAEAGVFTPTMRIGLAALMGMTCLLVGEYFRRNDFKLVAQQKQTKPKTALEIGADPSAYIPGILTAVGIFTLLGTVFAAYQLYHLIPPSLAFTGMALISFLAFGISLLQGPKIAGIGLLGSMTTPLLIGDNMANYPILLTYITIVLFTAMLVSHYKNWGWLASAALCGALTWMGITGAKAIRLDIFWLWILFAFGLFAMAYRQSRTHHKGSNLQENKAQAKPLSDALTNGSSSLIDSSGGNFSGKDFLGGNWSWNVQKFTGMIMVIWFSFWALIVLAFTREFNFPENASVLPFMSLYPNFVTCLGALALMVVGYIRKTHSALIIVGGVMIYLNSFNLIMGNALSKPVWIVTSISLSMMFMGLATFKSRRDNNPNSACLWAALAVGLPIMTMLLSSFSSYFSSVQIGILMGGVCLANTVLACIMPRTQISSKMMALQYITPAAIACIGAAFSYCFSAGYGLDGPVLTFALIVAIGLSLSAYHFLEEEILKTIAVGFAALTAAHVLFIQIPTENTIGSRVILNALWFYFALPSLVCVAGAWFIKRTKHDIWTDLLHVFALSFASLFAVFQIRHLMNNGDLLANHFNFDEMAMQVLVGLCFTLGGTFVGKRSDSKLNANETASIGPKLVPNLAMMVSLISFAMFGVGVCLLENPLFNRTTSINGGFVFNNLMIAYLLPAISFALIAWRGRQSRSKPYLWLCAGLSLMSLLLYITSMIRNAFNNDNISIFQQNFTDIELYTISGAWLGLGVLLLALGIKLKRQDMRLASACVIMLTLFKAFFIDMASLESALRALSFVVLGGVLIVIGRVYQRLLLPDKATGV